MKVEFGWEDGGVAQVTEIICNCGHEDEYDVVSSDTIWTCPICGKSVIFKWVGMTWRRFKESPPKEE